MDGAITGTSQACVWFAARNEIVEIAYMSFFMNFDTNLRKNFQLFFFG